MMRDQFTQSRSSESAYRRGFHQGAEVFSQLLAEGCTPAELRRWCRDLSDWRYRIAGSGDTAQIDLPPDFLACGSGK